MARRYGLIIDPMLLDDEPARRAIIERARLQAAERGIVGRVRIRCGYSHVSSEGVTLCAGSLYGRSCKGRGRPHVVAVEVIER